MRRHAVRESMRFDKRLHQGIRRGEITCSVRARGARFKAGRSVEGRSARARCEYDDVVTQRSLPNGAEVITRQRVAFRLEVGSYSAFDFDVLFGELAAGA